MIATNLKTAHIKNPMGIDIVNPSLSWICEGAIAQTAYEIKFQIHGGESFSTGKIATNAMSAIYEKGLESKQNVMWKIRLWDENNTVGPWSEAAFFEAGILNQNEFVARWINPEIEPIDEPHKPASVLKHNFTAQKGEIARAYITSHGVYEAFLNGKRIGNFVLSPGSNTYDKNLSYQTYDVSSLLLNGENEVVVHLGDGWYRSCSGVEGERNLYGEDIALYFQLEVDNKPVCVSNESWQATQNGPLRENDMQQGEVYDARLESLTNWHGVKLESFGTSNFICSNSVPIVEREKFTGKIIKTPNGETVIDYGQNIAGYIEFSLIAKEGDTINLTHGETLDENGNFTNENFQDRNRHKEGGIKQRILYTCKNGENNYKSKFTIFGFRYAKLETNIDLSSAKFTAIAVYSNMEDTGTFTCSNENLNQLVQNSIWSMKSNFCDVPTDCPTRERAAWTGDIAAFIETGMFFENCYPVINKWLKECQVNQYDDGKIANIAPRNNTPSFFTHMLAGSVGWGDACIIVPYAMYKRYNSTDVLKQNYNMMQKWYAFLIERTKQKPEQSVINKENPYADYTIESGVDYGEWCEPNVDTTAAMRTPQYKVSTAYLAQSGKMLSEIASILGDDENAKQYAEIAENAQKAYHHIATENGKIKSEKQAEYVRALAFNLLGEAEQKTAAEDLNALVVNNGYHLNTGFLSTPNLCSVLAKYGYVDTAYKLLLQDTMPSWLYSVKQGATTIWETWDGINEKGVPRESLNHYSYGAICGWLFSGVCGISINKAEINLQPTPNKSLQFAQAEYASPLGKIVSKWQYNGDEITYTFTIPSNAVANLTLPSGTKTTLTAGTHIIKE